MPYTYIAPFLTLRCRHRARAGTVQLPRPLEDGTPWSLTSWAQGEQGRPPGHRSSCRGSQCEVRSSATIALRVLVLSSGVRRAVGAFGVKIALKKQSQILQFCKNGEQQLGQQVRAPRGGGANGRRGAVGPSLALQGGAASNNKNCS